MLYEFDASPLGETENQTKNSCWYDWASSFSSKIFWSIYDFAHCNNFLVHLWLQHPGRENWRHYSQEDGKIFKKGNHIESALGTALIAWRKQKKFRQLDCISGEMWMGKEEKTEVSVYSCSARLSSPLSLSIKVPRNWWWGQQGEWFPLEYVCEAFYSCSARHSYVTIFFFFLNIPLWQLLSPN